MTRVVVVGGGIAGLTAAYVLARDAPRGTRVTIVDGASRLGGKLRVSPVGGLLVDEGAETFLARAPEGVELVRAVGLGGDLVHPVTTEASVVVDGRTVRLPTGTVLGVPGDRAALRRSGLLTDEGLAAVGADRSEPAPLGDPPVGRYVSRRLGRELVDRLVDPLLGGVYAGRADGLSLRATLPQLVAALEARGGGRLVTAARSVTEAAAQDSSPVFAALDGGLGLLPDAVARASRAEVRLRLPIRRVERTTGPGFRLTGGPVPDPVTMSADAVVVAAPAPKAAGLLAALAPWAAHELAAMEYASVGIVTLAYPAAALAGLRGSGLLVAGTEGRPVKAVTFSSVKWAHLAGQETAVLRASVGRHQEARVLQREDGDLVRLVAAQVAALTGVRSAPIAARVSRWGGALPQYAPGHLERVRRIRADVARVPGLAVCGAAFDGVGVPACIRSGTAAAAQVVAYLQDWTRGGRQGGREARA